MTIITRRVGRNINLTVEVGGGTFDLGLHDKSEAEAVSSILRDASNEIEAFLSDTYGPEYRPPED